jgi:hypothetical protein
MENASNFRHTVRGGAAAVAAAVALLALPALLGARRLLLALPPLPPLPPPPLAAALALSSPDCYAALQSRYRAVAEPLESR